MTKPPETGTLLPDDLTLEEVDSILDPGATGVPELSPARTRQQAIEKLRTAAASAKGEEKLILQARGAQVMGSASDPEAVVLAWKLMEEASNLPSLVAEVEAMVIIASTQAAFQGADPDDLYDFQTRCIELAAHLDLPVIQSQVLLAQAWIRTLSNVDPRVSLDLARRASDLVITLSPRTSAVHECLSHSASVLGSVAWASERNLDLARRFYAVALLHAREMEFALSAGGIHLEMGNIRSEVGDLTGARRHFQRANIVFQHHHAWFRAARAMYWLGRTQVRFDDLAGARRTLNRLTTIASEHPEAMPLTEYGVALLSGLIDSYDGDPAEAINQIEPLIDHAMVSDDSRTQFTLALAHCHERLGRYEEAAATYRHAFELSERIHTSRIAATTSGVVLSDEITALRSAHGALIEDAERNRALLQAILPPSAYEEFSRSGSSKARFHEEVAIFYSDFAGFTDIASGMPPQQLVEILGELFNGFDRIMAEHGCERVETIGDAYLAVAGMGAGGSGARSTAISDVAERFAGPVEVAMVHAALEVQRFLTGRNAEFAALGSPRFEARVGVHAGSIVAGLVGSGRIRFAVFGDAVNTAQRLEAGGIAGEVTISKRVADAIAGVDGLVVEQRESIAAKGKGTIEAFHPRIAAQQAYQ